MASRPNTSSAHKPFRTMAKPDRALQRLADRTTINVDLAKCIFALCFGIFLIILAIKIPALAASIGGPTGLWRMLR